MSMFFKNIPESTDDVLKKLDEIQPIKSSMFLVKLGILYELRELNKNIRETNIPSSLKPK